MNPKMRPKTNPKTRLSGLLDYCKAVIETGKKTETKLPKDNTVRQREITGLPGVHTDLVENGEPVWLRAERLHKTPPPPCSPTLDQYLVSSSSPDTEPTLRETARELPDARAQLDQYLVHWRRWAEEELPRQAAIRLYKKLDDFRRRLEQEEGRSELVWGIGIARWKPVGGADIDWPIITQRLNIRLNSDSSITLTPAEDDPTIERAAYRDIPGADVGEPSRQWESRLADEDFDLSPFRPETFREILRVAAAHLDPSGRLLPEAGEDLPAHAGSHLVISPSWVISCRSRSEDYIAQDMEKLKAALQGLSEDELPESIRKLVTEPADTVTEYPSIAWRGLSDESPISNTGEPPKILFFVKPYNAEQRQIVDRLEHAAGVVVQGPPGTGKTHTIANIICHYLANGKRVLVTSHKEHALNVLRDKLPEKIRPLVVSLGHGRSGVTAFGNDIRKIQGQISQMNIPRMKKEAATLEGEIDTLHQQLADVDRRLRERAKPHLSPLPGGGDEPLYPGDVASGLRTEPRHDWLKDPVPREAPLPLTKADMDRLRTARREIGKDLCHLGSDLPRTDNWPDAGRMQQYHLKLVKANKGEWFAFAGSVREKIEGLRASLTGRRGPLVECARDFLRDTVGRDGVSPDRVAGEWANLCKDIRRVTGLAAQFGVVSEMVGRVEIHAPQWARQLREEPVSGDDPFTPDNWQQAWQWRGRLTAVEQIHAHEEMRKLEGRRKSLRKQIEKKYESLVEKKIWIQVHAACTDSVLSAFNAFLAALTKIGAGTGKSAPRHRANASDAMYRAWRGVPCWIMPHERISETLPPEIGIFDLVIVDEASQSDLRALPALFRAKKCLVVGDDKQVSPEAGFVRDEDKTKLIHTHLQEQPYKNQLEVGGSLYDLARVAFPGADVMLQEHFRCVEPIIEFSRRTFYDNKIVPLRVATAEERITPPLVDVLVRGGYRRDGKKINGPEAEAIIAEIGKIIDDPRFSGRSIGVISLLGPEQAEWIDRMLRERLPADKIKEHKIKCGDARHFQGEERDIVLLSMVAEPDNPALTDKDAERRFNVAASRARDRMYLFRSVALEDLKNPEDLRRKLIEHFRKPLAHAPEQIKKGRERCESGFEREMFDLLTGKGYRVTPQVGSKGYRIDFVVEGSEGRRLAIECDGDLYHGPDKYDDDRRRQYVLERAGWTFWRCFASDFFYGKADEVREDLFRTLQEMHIEPLGAEDMDLSNLVEYREIPAPERRVPEESAVTTARPDGEGTVAGKTEPSLPLFAPLEVPTSDPEIEVGDTVYYSTGSDPEERAAQIVEGASRGDGTVGSHTPLGKALLGAAEREVVEAILPTGKKRLTVLRIEKTRPRPG